MVPGKPPKGATTPAFPSYGGKIVEAVAENLLAFFVLLLHLGIQLPSVAHGKRNLFFINWFVPLSYCCREQDCCCNEHLFVFVQELIPLFAS